MRQIVIDASMRVLYAQGPTAEAGYARISSLRAGEAPFAVALPSTDTGDGPVIEVDGDTVRWSWRAAPAPVVLLIGVRS
ncbi:hypothetical protein QCE63_04910 [Caballeronia sp. LZ065]|uniref:hypothetical protein n=1 Tax=Caballeronia sp. LZ065 TaxID=3038571 RepID=UPI00285A1C90|nr:hypothetical protein [Caballeronia sp. LZ065]MDR5778771.1 hypothetical protein [Caballeronia sp. LZ065]